MDFATARHNMVESQVRTWDVLNPDVLQAMAKLPREDFVPELFRNLAYADTAIPLADGQVMLPPKQQGRIIQAVGIKPDDRVLEICTGYGYLTALIAQFAVEVVSVDINPAIQAHAKENLRNHAAHHIELVTGDGAQGWDKNGQFDVIIITAGLPYLPDAYKKILNPGGRIFAILGTPPAMRATLFNYLGDDLWQETVLYETTAPLMQNAAPSKEFDF